MRRLGIVHRWSGLPGADWYPWLRDELCGLDPPPFAEIGIPGMPDPDRPDPDVWVPAVHEWLGDEPAELAETVLVGNSIGCQAVVRALPLLPAGARIEGCLLVAPWFWLAEDEQDETSALWEESAFDEVAARVAAGRVIALVSDDDPFTPDWEANGAAWEKRMGAGILLERGAGHFEDSREPRILEVLLERFGAQRG